MWDILRAFPRLGMKQRFVIRRTASVAAVTIAAPTQ